MVRLPGGKKTRGRQSIPLRYIESSTARSQAFRKRAKGVLKKAWELAVLTKAHVRVEIDFDKKNFYYDSAEGLDFRRLPPALKKDIEKAIREMLLPKTDGDGDGEVEDSNGVSPFLPSLDDSHSLLSIETADDDDPGDDDDGDDEADDFSEIGSSGDSSLSGLDEEVDEVEHSYAHFPVVDAQPLSAGVPEAEWEQFLENLGNV